VSEDQFPEEDISHRRNCLCNGTETDTFKVSMAGLKGICGEVPVDETKRQESNHAEDVSHTKETELLTPVIFPT
jgi:hypothetical protein